MYFFSKIRKNNERAISASGQSGYVVTYLEVCGAKSKVNELSVIRVTVNAVEHDVTKDSRSAVVI